MSLLPLNNIMELYSGIMKHFPFPIKGYSTETKGTLYYRESFKLQKHTHAQVHVCASLPKTCRTCILRWYYCSLLHWCMAAPDWGMMLCLIVLYWDRCAPQRLGTWWCDRNTINCDALHMVVDVVRWRTMIIRYCSFVPTCDQLS